jgi:hypothetical protein
MRSIGLPGCLLIIGVGVATLATSSDASAQSHAQSHDASPSVAFSSQQAPAASGDSAIMTLLTGPLGSRSVSGTATLSGAAIRVTLSGDKPGATRPWHIHRGTCNRDEDIVGSADAYPPIVIDSHGDGSATATLAAPLAPGVGQAIEVHDTAEGTALGVIACGTLTRPAQTRDASTMDMSKMEPMTHAIRPDSVASLLMAVYDRMMADQVIRERAATDPELRRLVAQLATARGAAAAASDEGGTMPGMTMPATPTTRGASPGSTDAGTRVKASSAKPARKPATKAAPTAAPRPPKDSMPPGMKMPGMGHGSMSMPGMGKP